MVRFVVTPVLGGSCTRACGISWVGSILLGAVLGAQEPQPQPPVQTTPPSPLEPTAPITGPQDPQGPLPVDAEAEAKGQPTRDLTLGDALRLARSNNLELRALELVPEQARQSLVGAEAIFNPELYGNTGYADSQSPQRNVFQPSISRQTIDATVGWRQRVISGGLFDLSYRPARLDTQTSVTGFPARQFTSEWVVSYTQPLLRGAWSDYSKADIDKAHQGVARSEQDYARSVQDTLLAVVQAYWDLVFARENYRIVQSAFTVAQEQLRITIERIRVRELAPRDRVADDAEVARRQEELIGADNAIRKGEDELRRLLFDDRDGQLWRWNLRPIESIEMSFVPLETEIGALVDTALANRPDLKAARSRVAEAELDLLKANRDLLPALDLVSTYSSDAVRDDGFRPAWDDSINQQYPDWGVRLEFSVPLGNQAARSRRRIAELEVERRQRDLYGGMLNVTKEVREAVRNLDSLSQAIRASAESVRLAETNLETEQVKLGVGSSTAFEVQRRNQELREARGRLLRNQLDYHKAKGRLQYAQGLLEAPRE
ncbi:MAG: TolC family protein [Planctomycetota bacterium]